MAFKCVPKPQMPGKCSVLKNTCIFVNSACLREYTSVCVWVHIWDVLSNSVTFVLHLLSCRYPGPVGCVGGWDELLRHEDRPQQRHLPPLPATQQSTGHRPRQVRAQNIWTHMQTKIALHNHTTINTRSLVTESCFTSLNRNKLSPYAGIWNIMPTQRWLNCL